MTENAQPDPKPAETLRPWKKPDLREEDYTSTELGSGGASFDLETYS